MALPVAMLARVKKLGGAAVIAAVLMMTGCSAPSGAPESVPSLAATTAPSPSASPLDELRAEYVEAGGQCRRITTRDMAVAEAAGDCDSGTLLSVYSSTSGRDTAIRMLEDLQATNPRLYVIAIGDDWIVNGADAETVASAMGGTTRQIGTPTPSTSADLSTDAGICAADAELTNLELNDALAPLLGYPADRDQRTSAQDEKIRAYKNEAFLRACPNRAG